MSCPCTKLAASQVFSHFSKFSDLMLRISPGTGSLLLSSRDGILAWQTHFSYKSKDDQSFLSLVLLSDQSRRKTFRIVLADNCQHREFKPSVGFGPSSMLSLFGPMSYETGLLPSRSSTEVLSWSSNSCTTLAILGRRLWKQICVFVTDKQKPTQLYASTAMGAFTAEFFAVGLHGAFSSTSAIALRRFEICQQVPLDK